MSEKQSVMSPLKAALIEVVETHLNVEYARAELMNAREHHDFAVKVLYQTDSELAADEHAIGPQLAWLNLIEVDGQMYLVQADLENGTIHDINMVDVVS